jgi:hypothetical protein
VKNNENIENNTEKWSRIMRIVEHILRTLPYLYHHARRQKKDYIILFFYTDFFFAQKIGPYLDHHARGGLFNKAHYGATVFLDRLHRHPTLANQQSVVLSL